MNFPEGLPQDCPSDTPLVMLGTSSALATPAALIEAAITAAAMNSAFTIRTLSADALGWSRRYSQRKVPVLEMRELPMTSRRPPTQPDQERALIAGALELSVEFHVGTAGSGLLLVTVPSQQRDRILRRLWQRKRHGLFCLSFAAGWTI